MHLLISIIVYPISNRMFAAFVLKTFSHQEIQLLLLANANIIFIISALKNTFKLTLIALYVGRVTKKRTKLLYNKLIRRSSELKSSLKTLLFSTFGVTIADKTPNKFSLITTE